MSQSPRVLLRFVRQRARLVRGLALEKASVERRVDLSDHVRPSSGTGQVRAADSRTIPVSVVVPTHGGRESVSRTVQALLAPNVGPAEVIVVSDGDANVCRQVLSTIDDSRLVILEKSQEGANAARNFGLQQAGERWVAFVDDDDVPRSNWGAVWESTLDGSVLVATASLAHWRDGEFRKIRECLLDPNDGSMNASRLMAGAFVVRHDILKEIGGYDISVPAGQNQDLGLRILDYMVKTRVAARIASTEDVVIDVYAQSAPERMARYGDRHAAAGRLFLSRYPDRMRNDPAGRAARHRVIARSDRIHGHYWRAIRHSWSAILAQPGKIANIRSLCLSIVPTDRYLGALRSFLVSASRKGSRQY